MSSRRWIVVVVVAVLAVPLAVMGSRLIALIEPPGGEDVYVVFKTTGPDMEFWQIVRAGIQAAAAELNLSPRIVGPRWETDIDEQISIFAEVIDAKPDAILLVASDYNRLVPLAERAVARGITVVTLDSGLNSDAPASFVATDNVAAGVKAGEEIDRLVPRGSEIALLSHIPGVATAMDREQGVLAALKGREPATIVGPLYAQNELDRASAIVRKLVAEHPRLAGIVAMNENSTVGAGRALRELGVADRIALVGFDNSSEEIDFLERGVVRALVVQRPFNMGYLGIRAVADALRGRKVDRVIRTDAVLVRKSDMFTEENQKLLFPIVRAP